MTAAFYPVAHHPPPMAVIYVDSIGVIENLDEGREAALNARGARVKRWQRLDAVRLRSVGA